MSIKYTTEILNIEQIFQSNYVIPIYQRNFAWGDEQICQLLQDIRESINEQQYYIGSLVVIGRPDGTFEVIDGQQRLTTLALLSYVLQFKISTNIHYDSRPEVVQFLHNLASDLSVAYIDSSTSHFSAAIETMKTEIAKMEKEEGADFREKFGDFVLNNVCLVREVMPDDTDVAAYFEIMNNRGEQLKEHEIIKGLLLGKIQDNPKLCQVCSLIWDACSQMDERLQKSFDSSIRKELFGDDYKGFALNDNNYREKLESIDSEDAITKSLNLDQILETNVPAGPAAKPDDEDIPDDDREESIIDFPNFLMHIMRLYYNDCIMGNKEKENIRLHDKYLLKTFRLIEEKIDATEFFYRLLRCRTIFDRYFVKANIVNDNDEEGREWSLLSPYKYTDQKRNRTQLKFGNTFGDKQDMIIKAISCIQVCHSSRYYKNYLQTLLKWFKDRDSIDITEGEYIEKLNQYIFDDLKKNADYFGLKEYTPNLQGTAISHAVLDYIDYIIWNIKVRKLSIGGDEKEWSMIPGLKDFRFQYWNSVEHHYPQKRKEELSEEGVDDFLLNCLGNTFLLGKSTNSRLSDKNPKDKATLYSGKTNLAPNRQMIYGITRESDWKKEQIQSHLQFIETVCEKAEEILGVQ